MAQHFLLTAAARELSLEQVFSMRELTAYAWFLKARWPKTKGEAVCPDCGNLRCYTLSRRRFRCSAKECRKEFTVTSGAVLASHKLSFKQMICALLLAANSVKGKAALQLCRELNVQYKTSWVLLMKLREAVSSERDELRLSGTVEIDGMHQTAHNRKANKRTDDETDEARERRQQRKAERDRVVMALRMREGRIVTAITRAESAQTASEMVKDFVDPDATVISDQHMAYAALDLLRKTERTDHSVNYVGDDGQSTNQVESFFSRVRRAEHGIHHRMSGKYFDWYVTDLAWREDMRQETNGWQAWQFLWKCLSRPTSRNLCGYWQGNKLPGEVLWEDEE